jgi:hypothetical protein
MSLIHLTIVVAACSRSGGGLRSLAGGCNLGGLRCSIDRGRGLSGSRGLHRGRGRGSRGRSGSGRRKDGGLVVLIVAVVIIIGRSGLDCRRHNRGRGGRVAVRLAVVGESLSFEHRVAAVIEKLSVVLGIAAQSHVTTVISCVRLENAFVISSRLGGPVNGNARNGREGSKSIGGDSEKLEHRDNVLYYGRKD